LAHDAGVPLVAIGGLTLAVASDVARCGALAAVISDLLSDGTGVDDIAGRARAWQAALVCPT
jgi:thiamine monophosphate synthase